MNLAQVKLVVTDMDGTLLNDQGKVSKEFYSVFKKLKSHNIHFAAASGRQYYSIANKLSPIVDDITIIAENGGIARRGQKELLVTQMDKERVFELITLLRTVKDSYIVLCGKKSSYIETTNETFINLFNEYYARYQQVDDLTAVKDDEFVKIAVYHFESSEEFIYPSVKHLEDELQVKVSGPNWVDISHPDAHKGHALQLLQEKLGYTPEQTMVFGDYNNDLEMLGLATYSYAMENAHPDVKKVANYSTKSNENNGVEYVLEQLIEAIESAKLQKL
ncbi:cof family hydrolase [Galbibacter marinus]|uniref:Cof family hydrolase n=1 Tax=Galbibacter marinus TaxID=555500 RepID=K2PZT6_9FLAO|nr:HAD family hydrolase [Galbibacter marinus]EKF54136.1 cof family hydrolase [Galbibacter marinus]